MIGALLSVLVWTCGHVNAQESGKSNDDASTSRLLTAQGSVQIAIAGTDDWKVARREQILRVGDRLRTGKRSRATVRLADRSVLRINQLSVLQIRAPRQTNAKGLVDLKSGSVYFFSRERPKDLEFQTPLAVGAIRGTEFVLAVADDGRTDLTLLDGIVDLSNENGAVELQSGEGATVQPGAAPVKTARIDAVNAIQWCLYYPAVLHAAELNLSDTAAADLTRSLDAYRAGDLLAALENLPDLGRRPHEGNDDSGIYTAALLLGVGQVEEASRLIEPVSDRHPLAAALKEMIAAVQFQSASTSDAPSTASGWLARSYYLQSRSDLPGALEAARNAAAAGAEFGFAFVRVAELEFGFGRLAAARTALSRGLELSPRNPQALALEGFFLSALNRFDEALTRFDKAIEIDGALGNAWLGRGLVRFRKRSIADGLADLQVAASLEPNRAILRSYLGKAFTMTGNDNLAEKELRLARELDPEDPTGWLYSALLNQQRNRINRAVRDLETSRDLNDRRGVFRSRLLLDQDRAVRSANLATVYRDAGMEDLSLREAGRAVHDDYANHSAHLFLAQSYDAVKDPKLINLRLETARISELLVGNLLAPPGAGNLSQNLSLQEYSNLLRVNGVGFRSGTEYSSGGNWVQSGTLHGTHDSTSFAVDTLYRSDKGQRPNNDLEQWTVSTQVKQQLTARDSLYLQAVYFDSETGDVAQYYDQSSAGGGFRAKESQEPNLFIGYHREWNPGVHTMMLAGRLDDTLALTDSSPKLLFLRSLGGAVTMANNPPLFGLDFSSSFEAYSTELQQVFQTPNQTYIVGVRYQTGSTDTSVDLNRVLTGLVSSQRVDTDLERISLYAYHQWQVFEPLRLTAGISYDHLDYPVNIDTAPVATGQRNSDKISPKAGFVYQPLKHTFVRGLYSRSLGGLFFDNSIRLEPTQIAGFNHAYRSLIPESAVGAVPGTKFETWQIGLDQSFPTTGTYLGVEAERLTSDGDRTVGALTNSGFLPIPDTPTGTRQTLEFEENSVALSVNQLIGDVWSLGARYRISEATLNGRFTDIPLSAAGVGSLNQDESSVLQQLRLFVLFNHDSGFFTQFESRWSSQSNQGYTPDRPGDDFWQHNIYFGYRTPHRRAEVRIGLLNLTDRDYRLNPLNLYAELPRERTATLSLKLNF